MKKYSEIISHYENCLEKYGDTHLGVDWPKKEDVDKRYKVMLDLIFHKAINQKDITLLDFGCGTAHLLDYIKKNELINIKYSGLDISSKFISVCKQKYPRISFFCEDILLSTVSFTIYDFIIMNGVFTEKRNLTYIEMWDYFTNVLTWAYAHCSNGLAFNVMSKNVDWERSDLFHVSFDSLSEFLCKKLTRNFVIRNDYGLYEYTVYIYK